MLTIIDNDYYLIEYNVNTKLNLSSFKYLDNIDIDLYDEDCEILDVNDNTIEEVVERYISKTDYRDVYKIQDTEMFVNIPTINLSKAIKKKFTNSNLTYLKVYCKYNDLYDNYNVIKL